MPRKIAIGLVIMVTLALGGWLFALGAAGGGNGVLTGSAASSETTAGSLQTNSVPDDREDEDEDEDDDEHEGELEEEDDD
jgi:hypothetical protein